MSIGDLLKRVQLWNSVSGNIAEVIAGAVTGAKGLRVYIGPTDPISDVPVNHMAAF